MASHLIPEGLRTRLLGLVVVSILCSALLLLVHELHQRDNALQRAHSEATLLGRLAATRAEQSLRGVAREAMTPAHVLASVTAAAREAGAVVRAGYGSRLPEVVSFLITDPRGHVLAQPGSAAAAGDSLIAPFEARTSADWHQDVRGGTAIGAWSRSFRCSTTGPRRCGWAPRWTWTP